MHVERAIGKAPRATALAGQIAGLRGGCVGCTDCSGLCTALIEALVLPGLVLKGKPA